MFRGTVYKTDGQGGALGRIRKRRRKVATRKEGRLQSQGGKEKLGGGGGLSVPRRHTHVAGVFCSGKETWGIASLSAGGKRGTGGSRGRGAV